MISLKSYRIITDGSCDMPASLAEEKRVTVVPFYVTMDEKTYIKENVDISKTDFYKWMVENKGSYPKSSTPSVQDYLDVFTEAAEAGEDVICICITRKFSTSFESAQMAADMLAETHPGCRVTVINAMVNTVLQALLVLEAVKLRDKGVDYDECVRRVKATRPTGRIFFTVGSIDYLRHGGRIGKLAGIAGTILGIRPVITLKEGEIFPAGITRSRQKSIEKVEALALDYVKENNWADKDYEMVVGYGYDYEDAVKFRDRICAAFASMGHILKVNIYHIGAAISVHTGPYPLGVGIIKHA